jgi:hypothetical protein
VHKFPKLQVTAGRGQACIFQAIAHAFGIDRAILEDAYGPAIGYGLTYSLFHNHQFLSGKIRFLKMDTDANREIIGYGIFYFVIITYSIC